MEGVDSVCCSKDIGPNVVGSWDVFDTDLFEGGLNDCTDQMVIL